MKALPPRSTGAAIVLASCTTLATAQDNLRFAKPGFRYKSFDKLSTTSQAIAEEQLGYTDISWNNFGIAPIEKKRWSELTDAQRDGASLLGFTEGVWDCYQNHYSSYTWTELAEEGIQDHIKNLGWTQSHWEGTADDIPSTEGKWWDLLTSEEKEAANGFCYFEDNWDEIDLTPNDSFFPHPFPDFRFKPWSELDEVTQNVASEMLGYDNETWDNLGTAVVERNTFMNLDSREREGAMDLGFYKHTWGKFEKSNYSCFTAILFLMILMHTPHSRLFHESLRGVLLELLPRRSKDCSRDARLDGGHVAG